MKVTEEIKKAFDEFIQAWNEIHGTWQPKQFKTTNMNTTNKKEDLKAKQVDQLLMRGNQLK